MLDFRVLTANRKTNVIFRQASVSIIDEYFDFLNEEQKRYQHAARWRNADQLNTENLAAMLAETRPDVIKMKSMRSLEEMHSHDRVASADWRPGRVYFLTLLEPFAGTTGLWPLPPGRPVSATVGELNPPIYWFTAPAVDQVFVDNA